MITVVVPILNERENIPTLLREINSAAQIAPISEIVYVDDGSTDGSFELLLSLRSQYKFLRAIRHNKRCGQSAALWTGIKAAGNELIVTLDGDGQNDPADIPRLYNLYKDTVRLLPRVMVAGERAERHDSWIKRKSSWIANAIRAWILQDRTRDTGCSLKLYRRKDYLNLPYFDHMHRYIPALMMRDKIDILHVPVSHRSRTRGVSKYGTLDRLAVGITDLFGVLWLLKRPFAHPETFEDLNEVIKHERVSQ